MTENRTLFPTRLGYLTEKIRRDYIVQATKVGVLPEDADQMPEVMSLVAPDDPAYPIQFWQLFSVLGPEPIIQIVQDFYGRVFAEDAWFKEVFERVGGEEHHVMTQASMWADVMGGGPYYHGAEFRLNFHHYHNAMALMNDRGAERWSAIMVEALDAAAPLLDRDARLRHSLNTFLSFFMVKYAQDFKFSDQNFFGETNGWIK